MATSETAKERRHGADHCSARHCRPWGLRHFRTRTFGTDRVQRARRAVDARGAIGRERAGDRRGGRARTAVRRSWHVELAGQLQGRRRAGLFRSRPALGLRLQSLSRTPRLPRGAASRSRLRDVLLGRGLCARPQHQCGDGGGRQPAGACRAAARRSENGKGEPARTGADRSADDALRRRTQGRARRPQRRLRRGDGQGARPIPRGRKHRRALCRCDHEHAALGLLAGRPQDAEKAVSPRPSPRSRRCSKPTPTIQARSISTFI